jgi:hypothetical protein
MSRDEGPRDEAIDRAAARDWRDRKAGLASVTHYAILWAEDAALIAQGAGVLRARGKMPEFADLMVERAIDEMLDAEYHLTIRLNSRCEPIPLAEGEVVLTADGHPHLRRHRGGAHP